MKIIPLDNNAISVAVQIGCTSRMRTKAIVRAYLETLSELQNKDVIELMAQAIEPRAFIGTDDEIHMFCSPHRVDIVQDDARATARRALSAMPMAGTV